MKNGHSKIGPSKADQWVNCPRSVSFIEELERAGKLPADTGSEWSREGTRAHEVAATKISLAYLSGQPGPGYDRDLDMPELEVYLDECIGWLALPESDKLIEEEVPLWYAPEDFGTVDFAVVTDSLVVIRDLKWGQGEFVAHENNLQLAIYAYSLIRMMENGHLRDFRDDTLVDIGIVQPRFSGEEKVRTWKVSLRELREFCEPIEAAAAVLRVAEETAASAGLPFNPGEKTCRWCRARQICPARLEKANEGMPLALPPSDALAALPPMDVKTLTDEQILKLVQHEDLVRGILKDAKDYALARALEGRPVPGTKMVQGREGNRRWADERTTDKWLSEKGRIMADQRYEKTLISPAKAQKLLPKEMHKRLESRVTRTPGRPVLVLDTDPRPAWADPKAALAALPENTDSPE